MKTLHSLFNQEKGFISILVGCSLLAFLTLFALVVDIGHLYVTKAELQNTADAAALAAIAEIPGGTENARQKAVAFAESHWVAGSQIIVDEEDVQFGHYNFQTRTYEIGAAPVNFVQVRARRSNGSASGAVELFFAKLFGKSFSNVEAEARAVLDRHVIGVHGKNRLIPFTVHQDIVATEGEFVLEEVFDITKLAPGNFGYLDLDDGANGTPELRWYIENGYDKDFIIPPGGSVLVTGSTGIRGDSVTDSFEEILGDVVFIPVHSHVEGTGSNAEYTIVDIVAVKILSVVLTGNQDQRNLRVKPIDFTSSVLVTHPDAPENNSLAKPRLVG